MTNCTTRKTRRKGAPLLSDNKLPNYKKAKQLVVYSTMQRKGSSLVVFAMMGAFSLAVGRAQGQCLDKTMTSFERIGGVTIKDAHMSILYQANVSQATIGSSHHHHFNSSSGNSSLVGAGGSGPGSGQVTLYQLSVPITAECNNRCRRSKSCRAFLVDYSRYTCWSVDSTGSGGGGGASGGGLERSPTPIVLVPTNERTAYFEKICLNLPVVECERAWMFERVLGYHLHGHDDKVIDDVPSRLKCQEHCLNERSFRCRSGEYDYLTMQCRLSLADRHMKQSLFRPTSSNSNIDYFENQCVQLGGAQCDTFERYEDLDLGRAEIMRVAKSSEECQQYCTQTIKAFICRSFTWSPLTERCYLNSANTFMAGGLDKLLPAPGLYYYQRNDCIDLKLECDTNSMTLNLRTQEPFRGRMYVRDEPNACETLGRSALLSSLSIPFQGAPMGARCAQREMPSRYSSVVVVQQHPLIQRKSDRYIKLVCDFQTSNKTITSQYNVMTNPWTSTALINATSFAPKILLRITDKFGNDITGAKLGDELQLRIEAETESVYDMVARSVLAKSGTTDESIVLIDRDGCPADYRIFPPLKKLNKRTIIGRFDAFKFSSDVVVRFQVDVQFCLNSCPPTNCLDTSATSQPSSLFNVNPQPLQPQSTPTTPGSEPEVTQPESSPTSSTTTSSPSEFLARSTTGRPINHPHVDYFDNQQQQQQISETGSRGSQLFDSSLSSSGQPRDLSQQKQQAQQRQRQKVSPAYADSSINSQLISNELQSGVEQQQQQDQNTHRRRRRRSTEEMPATPRHVPLQREIIVIESGSSTGSGGKSSESKKQSSQQSTKMTSTRRHKSAHLHADASKYELNQIEQLDSKRANNDNDEHTQAQLVCTTWTSLVFSLLAFGTLQLLTIGLCLAGWLRKSHASKQVSTTQKSHCQQQNYLRPIQQRQELTTTTAQQVHGRRLLF